jgi:hypothetical protein
MILDNFLVMASNVTTTTAAASTNYVDTVAAGDANVGAWFVVRTGAAAWVAKNGAPQTVFQLQTSDSTSFGLSGTATTLAQSSTLLVAALTANKIVWAVRIPSGVKRYVRGYFSISNYSAGSQDLSTVGYSMFIVQDKDMNTLLVE